MPVYEYKCERCSNIFEILKPLKEKDLLERCPFCKGIETKRIISPIGHIDFSKCSTTLHSGG